MRGDERGPGQGQKQVGEGKQSPGELNQGGQGEGIPQGLAERQDCQYTGGGGQQKGEQQAAMGMRPRTEREHAAQAEDEQPQTELKTHAVVRPNQGMAEAPIKLKKLGGIEELDEVIVGGGQPVLLADVLAFGHQGHQEDSGQGHAQHARGQRRSRLRQGETTTMAPAQQQPQKNEHGGHGHEDHAGDAVRERHEAEGDGGQSDASAPGSVIVGRVHQIPKACSTRGKMTNATNSAKAART